MEYPYNLILLFLVAFAAFVGAYAGVTLSFSQHDTRIFRVMVNKESKEIKSVEEMPVNETAEGGIRQH